MGPVNEAKGIAMSDELKAENKATGLPTGCHG
jgi:hypothetical protein